MLFVPRFNRFITFDKPTDGIGQMYRGRSAILDTPPAEISIVIIIEKVNKERLSSMVLVRDECRSS